MTTASHGHRPNTSAGLPKMNIPQIVHPRLKAETPRDLSIAGEAPENPLLSLGPRAKTMYNSLPTGLPLLSQRSTKSCNSVHQTYAPEIYGSRVPGDRGKYRNSVDFSPSYSVIELLYVLTERFESGSHGIKHLFRNSDPSGQGQVSREALRRIFQSLVGHIDNEVLAGVLKRLGLDSRSTFTYEDILVSLKDTERQSSASRQEWVVPFRKKELKGQGHPEDHLRYTDFSFKGQHASAAYCLSVLRDKFRNTTDFHIYRFLPSSSYEAGGNHTVHTFHLRGILKVLGLQITDDEFKKIWSRFDKEGSGLVSTESFLKVLGLDELGYPRSHSESRHVLLPKTLPQAAHQKRVHTVATLPPVQEKKSRLQEKCNVIPDESKGVATPRDKSDLEDKPISAKYEAIGELVRPPSTKGDIRKKMSALPRRKGPGETLTRIVDRLHYKFEENYTNLEMALNLFDFLKDGHISRIDLRAVLNEFGMKIQAMDMEQFLTRCGFRMIRGQVVVREFLSKLWNKSESGLVHRIVTNRSHIFNATNPMYDEFLTIEQLEAKLVDFFHGYFLSLLGQLRRCDVHNIGVVTQYEFKDCVERIMGQPMTANQWTELKQDVGLDPDGLVPYPGFLETFNTSPNAWNRQEAAGQYIRKIIKQPSSQVLQMKERQQSAQRQRDHELSLKGPQQKSLLQNIEEKVKNFEQEIQAEQDDDVEAAVTGPTAGDATRLIAEQRERPLVQVQSSTVYPPVHTFSPEGQINYCLHKGLDRSAQEDGPKEAESAPAEDRPLFVLQYIMRELLRIRFHTVDKTYKLLDRKMTGRISKTQYAELMRLCGFPLRSTEVDILWQTFKKSADNMCTFSGLIRQCSSADYGPPPITGKRPVADDPGLVELARLKHQTQKLKLHRVDDKALKPARQPTLQEIKEVLDKARPVVTHNWDVLRMRLNQLDLFGTLHVDTTEARKILGSINGNLSNEDWDILLTEFSVNSNGRFNYMDFLKKFQDKKLVEEGNNQPAEKKLSQKLSREVKSLRKALKRCDVGGSGFIEGSRLKNLLQSFGILLTDEEYYTIMTELDKDLTGQILYEAFLGYIVAGKI